MDNTETNTARILSTPCPYNNSYQTDALRLLFVCSVGMLRSPTAQVVASQRGHNARACGSDTEFALIPLSINLINWADHIIFVTNENFHMSCNEFEKYGYKDMIIGKATVWNLPDDYDWGDKRLCKVIERKLDNMGL